MPSPSHKWSPASFNWRRNYHPRGLIHLIPLEVDEETSQTLLEAGIKIPPSPHLFSWDLSPCEDPASAGAALAGDGGVWREASPWGAGEREREKEEQTQVH